MDTASRITSGLVLGLTLLIGIAVGLLIGCSNHEHGDHDTVVVFVSR